MAVAFDAASSSTSSTTFSHTVSGANTLLVVTTHGYWAGSTTATATGVTYAGAAMTEMTGSGIRQTGGGSSSIYSQLWYKIAPAGGANNIIVTFSAAPTDYANGGISFTGVDQTTGVNGYQEATITTGAPTAVTITSAVGDMTTTGLGTWHDNGDTTSQTLRWDQSPVGDNFGSEGDTAAGAATVTHTWTRDGADDDWTTLVGCNVIAAAGGVTTRRYSLPLTGMGLI